MLVDDHGDVVPAVAPHRLDAREVRLPRGGVEEHAAGRLRAGDLPRDDGAEVLDGPCATSPRYVCAPTMASTRGRRLRPRRRLRRVPLRARLLSGLLHPLIDRRVGVSRAAAHRQEGIRAEHDGTSERDRLGVRGPLHAPAQSASRVPATVVECTRSGRRASSGRQPVRAIRAYDSLTLPHDDGPNSQQVDRNAEVIGAENDEAPGWALHAVG